MVNSEADARRCGYVGRVGNFLEIGFDRYSHGKEQMVEQVEQNGNGECVDESVADEYENQTDIFERQRAAFPNT